MKIKQLSKERLDEAVEMFEKVFPKNEWPKFSMEASLGIIDPRKMKGFSGGNERYFWIAIEKNKLVGAIGIYNYPADTNEARWVNWFGVDPKQRGKGYGKKLLKFALDHIKKRNFKFARLYTSSEPLEKNAQFLYESKGLSIPKDSKRLMKICGESDPTIIVREKSLYLKPGA